MPKRKRIEDKIPWKDRWYYDDDYESETDYEKFLDGDYSPIDQDGLEYLGDDIYPVTSKRKKSMRRTAKSTTVDSQLYCDGDVFDCVEYWLMPPYPYQVLIDAGLSKRIELSSPENGVWLYGFEGGMMYKGTIYCENWEDAAQEAIRKCS